MTPLQKAAQILGQLEDKALEKEPGWSLPTLRYPQLAEPVISCASVIVAALGTQPDGFNAGQLTVECDAMQVTTFQITIARDCSWVANEDGTDDPAKVATASAIMDEDGEFLWDYAQQYTPLSTKSWTAAWALIAGLGISTLTLTTEVD